jgi:hypothetical protein
MLPFRNLSGQLSRRSTDIHLRRYRIDKSSDRKAFLSVIRSFQRQLPLAEEPKLLETWDFLYERSIGCVGVLKEWLLKALTLALRQDAATLTLRHLERTAKSVAQCDGILADARSGEEKLEEKKRSRTLLRMSLGLPVDDNSNSEKESETDSPSPPLPKNQRPGQRKPKRDPVGEAAA